MSHANKALFTKQAMYHALKKLITTKSINKITIKDITDTCGLNRQTFYYHFKDIYDLLEWSFQEEFRFIDSYLQKPEYTWEEIFAGSVKYISQNKYICQCIVCGLARDQLILSLHNSIYEIVRKIILHSLPQNQIPETPMPSAITCLIGSKTVCWKPRKKLLTILFSLLITA